MILSLLIGALIGAIAGKIIKPDYRTGCLSNIIAGLIGSSVGQSLFGYWGPSLAGMALIPSILGAIIVIAVASFFIGRRN